MRISDWSSDVCSSDLGCSVHYVSEEVDGGPIIGQAAVPVLPEDDADSLAARVLRAEHRLYPACLRLVAEGRARLADGKVPLAAPDRKSVVTGKSVSVRVDLGGRRIIKKKKQRT